MIRSRAAPPIPSVTDVSSCIAVAERKGFSEMPQLALTQIHSGHSRSVHSLKWRLPSDALRRGSVSGAHGIGVMTGAKDSRFANSDECVDPLEIRVNSSLQSSRFASRHC